MNKITLHQHFILQPTSKAMKISARPKQNAILISGATLRVAGKEDKSPPMALKPYLQGWVSPAVQTNKAKLTQPRKQGKAKTNLVYIN